MTNTPPLTNRASRDMQFPGFPYPSRPAMNMATFADMDYPSHLIGQDRNGNFGPHRQQLDTFDPRKDQRYVNVARTEGSALGNDDGSLAPPARDDENLYVLLVDAIKKRDTATIQGLLNQGLDVNYKMRDGSTPLDVAAKTGGLDLRYLQKYSPESIGRSYLQKSSEQQIPAYQPPPYYSQSRGQPMQFPLDHQMATPLLPPTSVLPPELMMMNPFSHSQDRYNVPVPPASYGFDLPKEMCLSVDRPMSLPDSYTTTKHVMLPQYPPGIHPLSKQYSDNQFYLPAYGSSKFDNRGREMDPHFTRTKHIDPLGLENYSNFNNSPQPNIYGHFGTGTMSNPTSLMKPKSIDLRKVPASLSEPKAHAQGELPIIDLTDSNSPDMQSNPGGSQSRECKSRSVPPPLLHSSTLKTKENNYRPVQSYPDSHGLEMGTASSYSHSIANPDYRALRPFGTSYGLPTPGYHVPSMSEQPAYVYDHLNRSHSAKGHSDVAPQKITSPWAPARYLTPSPHHISLEPRNKNESPSLGVKSKTLPQPTSDLAFNYPEGSKPEYAQLSKKYPANHDAGFLLKNDPYAMNKIHPWQYKDDSKLSPFENHVLDSAARGVKTKFGSKRMQSFNNIPHYEHRRPPDTNPWHKPVVDPKKLEAMRHAKHGSAPPTPKKAAPPPMMNGMAELARNSVIQSTTKYPENGQPGGDVPLELTSPKKNPTLINSTNKETETKPPISEDMLNNNAQPEEYGEPPQVDTADDKKVDEAPSEKVGEKSHMQNADEKETETVMSATRKRKLSDPSTSKKTCAQVHENVQLEDTIEASAEKPSTDEAPLEEKTTKRPRRSGDMEEYLYDWVMSSDDETVNDNSSDEDYNCPTKIAKGRGSRGVFATKPRTTRRMSSIRKSISQKSEDDPIKYEWTSDSLERSEPMMKQKRRIFRNKDSFDRKKEKKLKRKEKKKRLKIHREINDGSGRKEDIIPLLPVREVTYSEDSTASVKNITPDLEKDINPPCSEKESAQMKTPLSSAAPLHPEDAFTDIAICSSKQTGVEVAVNDSKALAQSASMESSLIGQKLDEEPAVKVRKKRKYTRRLDENGLPVKRIKKLKKAENNTEIKQKRKYRKRLTKDGIKPKNHESKSVKSKIDHLEETLSRDVSTLEDLLTSPTKASIHEETKDGKNDQQKISPSKEERCLALNKKSPRRKRESKESPDKRSDNGVTKSDTVSDSPTRKMKLKHTDVDDPHISNKDKVNTETSNCDTSTKPPSLVTKPDGQQLPVKIKKKPGRKPGWRKYPDGNPGAKLGTEAAKKVKKSKKPKGDGLPRFGMRKKGRGRRKMMQSKAIITVPGTSPVKFPPNSHDKTVSKISAKRIIKAELQKRVGRQCFRNKRLSNDNFLHVDCLDLGADQDVKNGKRACKKLLQKEVTKVNKITEELQSQEYEYVFDYELSLYNNDDQPCTSSSIMDRVKLESIPDCPPSPVPQCQSRPMTPLGSAACSFQSPLPQNFKKLWCNSAIGETQLHKAARHGYIDNLLYYLERGTNVSQSDNAGYSALHEACVHNHLEAAMLLIQYGADVNKNADGGTRPLHDAVEYDHLEMVRLMLACGADPMLSKFSGRAIMNMIHSPKMGNFLRVYLRELKDITEEMCEDEELRWKIPCSSLFDKPVAHGFNVLDDPPPLESDEPSIEFELFDEPPITTYLLQPEDESPRTNFCLLDDFLKVTRNMKSDTQPSIRVQTITAENFRKQVYESWLHRSYSHDIMSERGQFVELVATDSSVYDAIRAEVVHVDKFPRNFARSGANLDRQNPTVTSEKAIVKRTNVQLDDIDTNKGESTLADFENVEKQTAVSDTICNTVADSREENGHLSNKESGGPLNEDSAVASKPGSSPHHSDREAELRESTNQESLQATLTEGGDPTVQEQGIEQCSLLQVEAVDKTIYETATEDDTRSPTPEQPSK